MSYKTNFNTSSNFTIRRFVGDRFPEVIQNLININGSADNYLEDFLQFYTAPEDRKNIGLQEIFNSIFPISDQNEEITVEFLNYSFDPIQYTAEECEAFDLTYCVVLRASFRLIVSQKDKDTDTKKVIDIKEEKNVFFCEIPIPDESGSFIINGTKKVIVSQIHRSPGVFFYHDQGKSNVVGKLLYGAKIVPYRGSWLDLEFDLSDVLYFRIDKKRKLPVTTLLRSIGMSEQEIYDFFYTNTQILRSEKGFWYKTFNPDEMSKHRIKYDLVDADTSKVILKAGEILSTAVISKLSSSALQRIVVDLDSLLGMVVAADVVDLSGNVLLNVGQEITKTFLDDLRNSDVVGIKILNVGNNSSGNSIRNTLFKDKNKDQDSALIDVCKVLRPSEKPVKEIGSVLIEGLFFSKERYDLSTIGRIKLNHSLGVNVDESNTALTKDDIKAFILRCVMIKDGKVSIDDIDHLGNRRIRTPAELVGNQIVSGLKKAQRNMLLVASNIDPIKAKPSEILQLKPLLSSLREFFNISQMVQFMDHTNPLSEITHKKRISALGPGGVDRVRAGLEIRDVHQTHYGRICSIETPEGSNIGLISALTTCAKINKFGFLEAPYFKVENGKISDQIIFLSSDQESQYYIGQSGLATNKDGLISDEIVYCRHQDGYAYVKREEVAFVDISPVQVVSVASSLIPFVENNDAKRSLMGANMQRQAVPLLKTEAPFVGTGVENIIGKRKGVSIVSDVDGVVEYVDGDKIILKSNDNTLSKDFLSIHNLNKFLRSNYNTCINQRVKVNVGDTVKKGDVIADGHSVSKGELALGANILVAILPYKGYSFQDSIVISERVIQEDLFTSIHIEELEMVVRDTRLGPEEITRDVPNVSEDMLANLDETGIVYVGAKVKPRDILIGKVTPQAEKPLSPEEKMLKAIFGEKANNVVDSSLYVPFGISGTVIDVKILSRRGIEKDSRTILYERSMISSLQDTHNAKMKIIRNSCMNRIQSLVLGQKAKVNIHHIKSGDLLTEENLSKLQFEDCLELQVSNKEVNNKISDIKEYYKDTSETNKQKLQSKIEKATLGHLGQGSLKVIKVFIAYKSGLQSGDKLSGRHGNKGVVSKIVPQEDMPFLEDGTVVDVILNPLGIPARMNIGQVFETHLGWVSKSLGNKISDYIKDLQDSKSNLKDLREFIEKIYDGEELEKVKALDDDEFLCFADALKNGVFFAATPFSGNKIANIKEMLTLAGQDTSGQVRLRDGCTGEYIDKKVTVGIQYLLKLHHLVDDKVHARSVGPYSLVTQQPLGGKGQFGGQRFGEMEGWALQAYGAAYTLREMLTIKSDDVAGRAKVYQEITKGSHNFEYGIPESFNVIVKEMQSLCLNVRLEKKM